MINSFQKGKTGLILIPILIIFTIWGCVSPADKTSSLESATKTAIIRGPKKRDSITEREIRNAQLSRYAATQGMVLLENENILPLKSKKIALFGGGAYNTVKGGTGSGDVNQRDTVTVYEAFMESTKYEITSDKWLDSYISDFEDGKMNFEGSMFGPPFNLPDPAISETDIVDAADADTAIYVISRISGEGGDRTNVKGDYQLTDNERANIEALASSFKNTLVILNVGGIIDTKFYDEISDLDGLLLMSQAGMEGGNALIDILDGTVTPSGKLTDSWAVNYSDYPSSEGFSSNDGNIDSEFYVDDIYVGYRYFDSNNIEPQFPFGYGLSYTTFDIETTDVTADADSVVVSAKVTNTGKKYSGKEVVQIYYSEPSGKVAKVYQELAAFGKTDTLEPGESQTLKLTFKTSDMNSFDSSTAKYVMDKGDYIIRVGNSSRNTSVAAVLNLDDDVTVLSVSNHLQLPNNELSTLNFNNFYSYSGEDSEIAAAEKISIKANDFTSLDKTTSSLEASTYYTSDTSPMYNGQGSAPGSINVPSYENSKKVSSANGLKLIDVANGKISLESFVSEMSIEEMATLNSGIGWGGFVSTDIPVIGSQSDSVPGAAGETTSVLEDKYGIPSIVLSDGPAGLRITQEFTAKNLETGNEETFYQFCTAWPIGTLLAQSWDSGVIQDVADAVGEEMFEFGVTLWLAPGMNIHRNPLCGRNFEYYSEDPVLSGSIASYMTLGVQSHPGIGVTIKHYVVNNQENNRNAVDTIVSERALREIYLKGFQIAVETAQPMAIMTSYNLVNHVPAADSYDMNTFFAREEWGFKGMIMTDWGGGQSTPSISMHAGNDMIMPGGTDTIDSIIDGVEVVPAQFNDDGTVKVRVTSNIWSGEDIKTELWGDFVPVKNDDGTYKTSVVNGKTVYEGSYVNDEVIGISDIQKSAINNLNIIIQSLQMEDFYDIDIKPYSYQFDLISYFNFDKSSIK